MRQTSLLVALIVFLWVTVPAPGAEYVIQISVDGLRPGDMQSLIDADEAPNFARFQNEGAGTNHARVDQTKSLPFEFLGLEKLVQTLPNHTAMMTSRPIERDNDLGDEVGHGYTSNDDPPGGETVHNFESSGAYKASAFDVAHDHGLRTGLFAAKGKFILFEQTWSAAGAPDVTPPVDHGTDKIDVYVNISDAQALVTSLVDAMQADPIQYVFLHFRDPDSAGHDNDFGSAAYVEAIRRVDTALGSLFALIDTDSRFQGRTAMILSSDHGGGGVLANSHVRYDVRLDAEIPFYLWGDGIAVGRDLYELNAGVRFDPGSRIEIGLLDPQPPFRNGDGGNLALQLLGLGPIPGSVYNAEQNIVICDAPDDCLGCPADLDGNGTVGFDDVLAILSAWGASGGPEDIDASGLVDFGDLLIVLGAWGPCD